MTDDLFARAGSLREAYAAVDWAATPLGPVDGWSTALRGAVDLMLTTRFPVTLLWGPEYVLVYNEAYVDLIAGKHPRALGRTAEEIFPEAWHVIGPLMEGVRADGQAILQDDTFLPLERSGFLEECWFSYSYSAVRGDDGEVEGLIDISFETTTAHILGRRLELLSRLGDELGSVQRVGEVPRRALAVLRQSTSDLVAVDVRVAGVDHEGRDDTLPAAPRGDLGGGDLLIEPAGERDEGEGDEGDEGDEGMVAWLPLAAEDPEVEAVLVVRLNPMLRRDADYLGFLRLVAAALTQSLEHVLIREAERTWFEGLQRGLMPRPTTYPGVELAVRYQPAAEIAQVGGDWYDAFRLPDGDLALVVGDVAGHDSRAAASMGQIRNMLRGVAYSGPGDPASILSRLDETILGVEIPGVATAVLAELTPARDDGSRGLRWTNAGHPPPVLLAPDGTARLLETEPDLLLGMEVSTDRHDHRVDLAPGSLLVFYTDGLVERRTAPIEDGLAWLVGEVTGRHGSSAAELSDHLLGRLDGHAEDDVALLVVRTGD